MPLAAGARTVTAELPTTTAPLDAGDLLVRLRLTDWAADAAQLVHGHAVVAAMEHHAWLERAQTR